MHGVGEVVRQFMCRSELQMNTEDYMPKLGPGINSRAKSTKSACSADWPQRLVATQVLHVRHNPASSPSGLCFSQPMNLFMGYKIGAYDVFSG
jgi:hypothetical protein